MVSYEDKLEYIKVVAERGAEARRVATEAGQKRHSRFRATAIYKAMGAEKSVVDAVLPDTSTAVLPDIPEDRNGGVSSAWARHVRKVFVMSYLAGEPKPLPPA